MTNRPPYNEFPIWSSNSSARSGKPTIFLIHTQEGGGGDAAAENLAKWFQNGNGVSYHYTISQASDGGVTVVDCVDTDRAAWSVGNANSISINLCFAGSRAAWTRDQWMGQKNAIDTAAYLAVQDAKKYGFEPLVVPPPYTNGRPGISDHRWVTDVFKWGTHTDVGPNFPWDYFTERVAFWAGGGTTEPQQPEPPKEKKYPADWSDRELLERIAARTDYIYDQLGPGFDAWGEDGDLGRNENGERRTLRAGLAALMRKMGAL
ncbi:lysin A [Mycobacterium phage Ritam007]|nr:lysinA [Mycobacterium phage Saroj]UZV39560.1 lysin A [Mycobacterium phage Ritam007]